MWFCVVLGQLFAITRKLISSDLRYSVTTIELASVVSIYEKYSLQYSDDDFCQFVSL